MLTTTALKIWKTWDGFRETVQVAGYGHWLRRLQDKWTLMLQRRHGCLCYHTLRLAATLTFDLQDIIRSLVRANGYYI